MIAREIPLFATQFGTFFYLRKFVSGLYGCKIDDLPTLPIIISGGASGFACWVVGYPLVSIYTFKHNAMILGHYKNKALSREKRQVCCLQSLHP